ncbi:hypothetical protein ON010_g13745 [Phytophthora cinnamomi]|nr:hypothetical protein ON010_g13745 [Phytophthora cinnamomi]
MKFAIAAALASLLIVRTSAEAAADIGFTCAAVPYIRCDGGHDTTKVCGSDGVTYDNKCEFFKADCDNKGLRVLHNGMCSRSEGGRRLRDAQP